MTTITNTVTVTTKTAQVNCRLTEEQQGQIIKLFWEQDGNKMDHWDAMDTCNEYELTFRNPNFVLDLDYALAPKYTAGVDYGENVGKLSNELAYVISRLMFSRVGYDETFMSGVITHTKSILMLHEIIKATLKDEACSEEDIDFAINEILELEIEDIVQQYDIFSLTNTEKFQLTQELLDRRLQQVA